MERHQWAGTLIERKRETAAHQELQDAFWNDSIKNKAAKLKTRKPRIQERWERPCRIPQRGNFSFYPTLFIASQEMFANCEIIGLESLPDTHWPHDIQNPPPACSKSWPIRARNFILPGANDIHERR
jgi:hypothetical protein